MARPHRRAFCFLAAESRDSTPVISVISPANLKPEWLAATSVAPTTKAAVRASHHVLPKKIHTRFLPSLPLRPARRHCAVREGGSIRTDHNRPRQQACLV